uniref:WH2 domain-containing protein n=1 Tax=Steinernema glaseri TaxID=37863 RepID=A0A1I8AR41_9BILA
MSRLGSIHLSSLEDTALQKCVRVVRIISRYGRVDPVGRRSSEKLCSRDDSRNVAGGVRRHAFHVAVQRVVCFLCARRLREEEGETAEVVGDRHRQLSGITELVGKGLVSGKKILLIFSLFLRFPVVHTAIFQARTLPPVQLSIEPKPKSKAPLPAIPEKPAAPSPEAPKQKAQPSPKESPPQPPSHPPSKAEVVLSLTALGTTEGNSKKTLEKVEEEKKSSGKQTAPKSDSKEKAPTPPNNLPTPPKKLSELVKKDKLATVGPRGIEIHKSVKVVKKKKEPSRRSEKTQMSQSVKHVSKKEAPKEAPKEAVEVVDDDEDDDETMKGVDSLRHDPNVPSSVDE